MIVLKIFWFQIIEGFTGQHNYRTVQPKKRKPVKRAAISTVSKREKLNQENILLPKNSRRQTNGRRTPGLIKSKQKKGMNSRELRRNLMWHKRKEITA